MEIPKELKNLYKHWEFHISKNKSLIKTDDLFLDNNLFNEISLFIKERQSIWEKKYSYKKPPYTKDEILSKYRFCNIFREFDRQTIEFHTLLKPLENNFALWLLNMFYCRMVARPETIQDVGLLSFNNKKRKGVYNKLINHDSPKYGTPYIFPISVIMRSKTPTRELFITEYLPTIMKDVAKEIQTWDKISVAEGVDKIVKIFGFNLKFLWTEVLIDVAYQYPQYIDLYKEFPVGPGSLPTMKRINKNIEPSILARDLSNLNFDTGLTFNNKKIQLSAENWEGIGCEFRKYTNLKAGGGRKRIYTESFKRDNPKF